MLDRNTLDKALGEGIRYPDMFASANGSVSVISGRDKIKQSIDDILSTRIGQRVGAPEYGSRLHELIFEMNDDVLADLAELYTKRALDRWEDRIRIHNIDVINPIDDMDDMLSEHYLNIRLVYSIRDTNIRDEYLYKLEMEGGS